MENKNLNSSRVSKNEKLKEQSDKTLKYIKKKYNKKMAKKAAIKRMPKEKRIRYYTKELFFNACLAFVWDFFLRVVFQAIFFKKAMPSSIFDYFYGFLFVKFGFYYVILWIISTIAVVYYFLKKDRNVKVFYICWISVLFVCSAQILIGLRDYVHFVQLVGSFQIQKLYDLFAKETFQIDIFALIWSITNIYRFIFVTNSMVNISIDFTPIEDEIVSSEEKNKDSHENNGLPK